jgi:hypothetical protein
MSSAAAVTLPAMTKTAGRLAALIPGHVDSFGRHRAPCPRMRTATASMANLPQAAAAFPPPPRLPHPQPA